MDSKNKNDVAGEPEAGTRDPKGKQAQLDKHPRKGRNRVPNIKDELDCGTENKTSQEKVHIPYPAAWKEPSRQHQLTPTKFPPLPLALPEYKGLVPISPYFQVRPRPKERL